MSASASPSAPSNRRPSGDATPESALWRQLSAAVPQDPIVARAMLDLFEAQPQLVSARVATYVAAKVTVQRDRIRYAKAFRHGQRVASLQRASLRAGAQLLRCTAAGGKVLLRLAKAAWCQLGWGAKAPTQVHLDKPLWDVGYDVVPEPADEQPMPSFNWAALDAYTAANDGATVTLAA